MLPAYCIGVSVLAAWSYSHFLRHKPTSTVATLARERGPLPSRRSSRRLEVLVKVPLAIEGSFIGLVFLEDRIY